MVLFPTLLMKLKKFMVQEMDHLNLIMLLILLLIIFAIVSTLIKRLLLNIQLLLKLKLKRYLQRHKRKEINVMSRKYVNKYRDRKIYARTSRVKRANLPGHLTPRGGQCL